MDTIIYFKSLVGLAIVLGLLFLFYRGMRAIKNKGYAPAFLGKNACSFSQGESFMIDSKRRVVVIAQGARRYTLLLGGTDILLNVEETVDCKNTNDESLGKRP